jgi:large subunit ribosomal protein L22
MSPYKARQVLDLIRGRDVDRAEEILRSTPREAARVVAKVLGSAVSNARNNDQLDPEDLYVSACFADEGATLKRWRPRARGRATRIRKRTCHITVIVSRLPEDRLERHRARQADRNAAMRARRVSASRRTEEKAPEAVLSAGVEEAPEPSDLTTGGTPTGTELTEGTEPTELEDVDETDETTETDEFTAPDETTEDAEASMTGGDAVSAEAGGSPVAGAGDAKGAGESD